MMTEFQQRPDLTVIVVTHDRTELALTTLSSARSAAGPIDISWHVIDSGSTEPTADEIEREWPDIHVTRCENVGFAAANNRGLKEARGRYILLLNPDVEIVCGTLSELVSALDGRPSVGMASVTQLTPGGSLEFSIRRDPNPWRLLAEAVAPPRLTERYGWGEIDAKAQRYAQERAADWLCGAFLIARADALQAVGPLDERFFLYSEETDWCYRCRLAGWEVRHLPVMQVIHHRSTRYSASQLAQLSYSKLLFARKHFGRRRARQVHAAVALRHAARASAFGGLQRVSPSFAARAAEERRALSTVLNRAHPPFAGRSGP